MGKLTEGAFRKALKANNMAGDGQGLWLTPIGGHCYWYYRYMLDGRRGAISLGRADRVGLAQARAKASALHLEVKSGNDPREATRKAKAERQQAKTFGEAAEAFLDVNKDHWRGDRTYPEWRHLIQHGCRRLLNQLVVDIDTDAIMEVLDPIAKGNPRYANDLRVRIERVLDYCTARKWRTGDNPARWQVVKHLMPLPKREVKHHAALPWKDLPLFMQRLNPFEVLDRCTAFCILTASRATETCDMLWSEVDMDEKVWTIPAARMKAGRQHRVPLSNAAMSVLRLQSKARRKGSDYVFPGVRQRRHEGVNPSSLWTKCRKLGAPSIHGFRSAFRDFAAENGVQREIAELCLAHETATATERAYRRSDLLQQRRDIMQAWGQHCLVSESIPQILKS